MYIEKKRFYKSTFNLDFNDEKKEPIIDNLKLSVVLFFVLFSGFSFSRDEKEKNVNKEIFR